ncbi:hypothetical protein JCM11491_001343 [Sporobolomyces phaffii]
MASQIDLSEFDPYSPTTSSSALFGSSSSTRNGATGTSVPHSTASSHVPTHANRTDDDPLSLFSQLELGGGARSSSPHSARNGNSSQPSPAVRAQRDRNAQVLSDLSREPFHAPVPIPTLPSPRRTPSRSHSGFSPPRRLSSLMDLGDHTYAQYPQFSPPMSSSPTLAPFHPLPPAPSDDCPSASQRMRQASEDWAAAMEDGAGTRNASTRERSLSGEWGDFQTATPPTPGTSTSSPASTQEPLPSTSHLPPPVPASTSRSKPSPRRSSTTPLGSTSSSSHPKLPTSASTLSSYDLKNLPAPPAAASAFDPFNQPVTLTGLKPGVAPILTETIAEGIRPCLAPRLRISSRWTLLYSLDQHGTSLLTLFTQVSNGLKSRVGGFVFVVRTERGQVFGGYVSEAFKSDSETGPGSRGRNGSSSAITGNRVWGGDGTSFLFTTLALPPSDPRLSPLIKTYLPTYHNTYFQHASLHSGIALGGGNDGKFGLWVDERLERGWTGRSETFGNDPLTGGTRAGNGNGSARGPEKEDEEVGKFEVVGVECWAVGT